MIPGVFLGEGLFGVLTWGKWGRYQGCNVICLLPLDPKTMKNEGFNPPIHGFLYPLKVKVLGSNGRHYISDFTDYCRPLFTSY